MNSKYPAVLILLCLVFLFPAAANSQSFNDYFRGINIYPDNRNGDAYPYVDTILSKQHIREMSSVTYIKEKKLKLYDSVVSAYNKDGIQNETKRFLFLNKRKSLVYSYHCIYDEFKRPVTSQYYNYYYNRTFNYQTRTYHDTLRTPDVVIRTGGKNNRTKFTYYTHYNYDKQNRIITASSIRNNNLKKATYMQYERQANGNLEAIKVYDAKNKLIYTYNYNCDKKGTLEVPKKELQQACLLKNKLPNGHSQTVEVIENEMGIRRTISEYDTSDRLIYIFVYSGKKGTILVQSDSFFSYNKDSSKAVYTYYYYKGRKLKSTSQIIYLRDHSNKVLSKTYALYNKKNKTIKRETSFYKYNSIGLLDRSESYDSIKRKYSIAQFSYKSY